MSVRNYAVLYLGKGAQGGAAAGGGNVVLNGGGAHALDGPEHLPAGDATRLDASATAHGLLPKLSGDGADILHGDGTWGTDNPMTAAGDLIVGGAGGAYSRLAKGSDGHVLTVDPTTHLLVWAAAPGAGMATDTLWDAKGDLAGGTGSNTAARLAVGADGTVLTADAAEPTGMKWAAAGGGGGGGALTYIGSTVLGADAATISYSSIPGSYKDLILVTKLRGTNGGAGIGASIQFGNGSVDTGSNYGFMYRYAGWTSGTSTQTATTSITLAIVPNSGATAGFFGRARFEILGYASSTAPRVIIGNSFAQDGSGVLLTDLGGHWKNMTQALDILTLTMSAGNFLAGSAIYLYGRG